MSQSIDKIISKKLNCEVTTIMIEAISEDNIYCKGIILENNFPIELLDEIYYYERILKDLAFSLLDNVEYNIYSYYLYLEICLNLSIKIKN